MRRRRAPRPPFHPALPLLRRRVVTLLALLPAPARAFVRLAPLLLEGRFKLSGFDQDPPGLVKPLRRRRWGKLCEQLGLPPPLAFCQRRPLVQSVVLAPSAGRGFELLVVPVPSLAPVELNRLTRRVELLCELAERHAPQLEVRMAGAGELTPALFAWAGVLGGDLPAITDEASFDWHDAFARAPTPLLEVLMLLVPREAHSPLALLRTTQVPVSSAPAFVAAWSGHPVARDVTTLASKALSPAEVDGLARQLRRACLVALRRIPLRERASVRGVVRSALLARRIPSVLRPQLDATLARHPPREVQEPTGWRLELGGLVLLRARTLEQLRAHALAESPRLAPGLSELVEDGPTAARTVRPAGRSSTGSDRPGLVLSQRLALALDSGVAKALVQLEPGGGRHLVVGVPAGGRPVARRVDQGGLFEFLLAWHRRGAPVEVLASPGCEPPLIARCSQLLATRLSPDDPVALQLGDRVILHDGARVRRLALERTLTRPRRVTWIAEQADMARSLRRPLATGLPTVQLVAFPHGPSHAALFAVDASGVLYRELVQHEALEATLHELREVLRHADPPSLLSASVHPLLTSLAGRVAQPGASPVRLGVELSARGDRATLDDEVFGAGAELPWSALAEAILSHWPPGTWGHVGVDRVMAPAGTTGLSLLAARSRVLRRVRTHLHRIALQLRAA